MSSLKSRVLRRGVCGIATLGTPSVFVPPPTIREAIPGYDGLLPITALGDDLEINVPWWNGVEPQMRLQVAWKEFHPDDPNEPEDPDLVGVQYVVTPAEAADPDTIFKLFVPKILLLHGTYILRVRASSFPGGVNDWSPLRTVRVDTVAPGGGALPLLIFPPQVVASNTIMDSDIVDGLLHVQLAHYEGIARGDKIELWIELTPGEPEELRVDPDPEEGFLNLAYTESHLEEVGNGPKSFSYKVTDKAGNFAGSTTYILNVQLHTTPTEIPAPTVPQADPDFLDEAEARAGTRVGITAYDLAQVGDEIVVHWGSQTSERHKLEEDDLGEDPFITVELDYSLVVQETSKGKVQVTFEVFRNGTSLGISEVNEVTVDLTIPGGPDPDPETPINENLLPLIARSAGAGDPPAPGEDNVIPPEDYEEDARVIISWLDVDGEDIYELDDEIVVTWGAQTTLPISHKITQQDLTAAKDLVLTVPTATVQAEGSGTEIKVTYVIKRLTDTRPPVANTAFAPPTEVSVTGPDELPGSGVIDPPVFTVLNGNGAIGQAELIGPEGGRYNPVKTKVMYDNVSPGDTVQLFFSGYDDLFEGTLIPEAAYEPTHVLQAADFTEEGYTFQVPARYHIAICSRGRVEAYVVFTNGKGPAQSTVAGAYCDVKFPSQPDCSNIPS